VAGGACCAQAVVLVGGEGTRLRPITSRVPKPVVPLVGRPFVGYILENLARHGVERVVFSAGYLAHALEDAIGDGSRYGLDVRYVVEDRPLGTAGAIRNVQAELDDGCLLAFNGDVLTDVDLTAMSAFHRERGGLATILLTRVDDPRRYGLVEIADDGRVTEFIEKPGAEHAVPTRGALINAGVYLLEPEVLAMIPAGRQLSIERGVFPELAAAGRLYAFVSNAYWRDIGTPESYLQAHFDLLRSAIATSVSRDVGPSYLYVAPGSRVGPLAVIGSGCTVAAGAEIVESVVQDGVTVGPGATIERSVVVSGASVGENSYLANAVVGHGCRIGADNVIANGCCLYPDTVLADGAMKFREFDGVEGR
jgi:mannose-1-phosphate guanylyltransferase